MAPRAAAEPERRLSSTCVRRPKLRSMGAVIGGGGHSTPAGAPGVAEWAAPWGDTIFSARPLPPMNALCVIVTETPASAPAHQRKRPSAVLYLAPPPTTLFPRHHQTHYRTERFLYPTPTVHHHHTVSVAAPSLHRHAALPSPLPPPS